MYPYPPFPSDPPGQVRYRIANSQGELLLKGHSDDAGEINLFVNNISGNLTIQLLRD